MNESLETTVIGLCLLESSSRKSALNMQIDLDIETTGDLWLDQTLELPDVPRPDAARNLRVQGIPRLGILTGLRQRTYYVSSSNSGLTVRLFLHGLCVCCCNSSAIGKGL
jgi:hypothetical protein